MPRFERGLVIKTILPTVTVDAGLPVGTYRFRLVVVDNSGNRSKPVETEITIERRSFLTGNVLVTPTPTRTGGVIR